jgi:hypothetical protein
MCDLTSAAVLNIFTVDKALQKGKGTEQAW